MTAKGRPIDFVLRCFGSIQAVADVVGLEPAAVRRWEGSSHGRIGHDYFRPLLDAAAARGLPLSLEEVVLGGPEVSTSILPAAPLPEPLDALGAMARALTR